MKCTLPCLIFLINQSYYSVCLMQILPLYILNLVSKLQQKFDQKINQKFNMNFFKLNSVFIEFNIVFQSSLQDTHKTLIMFFLRFSCDYNITKIKFFFWNISGADEIPYSINTWFVIKIFIAY